MTDKTIRSLRPVGGDYFRLVNARPYKYKLQYYLDQFNPEDYWIYKGTRKQRKVTTEDLYEFKYSGYTFFRKDLYDYTEIDEWIDFTLRFGGFNYLSCPFPPREIMNRINIIQ